jgi:hypothetical protein
MKTFDRSIFKSTFITSVFFLFLTVILYNSCAKVNNETDYITQSDINSLKKEHIIPLKEAVDMYKKYDKDRVKILKDTLKEKYKNKDFKDTRMVWFDIKTIEAYIKYVKEESNKAGIDPEGLQFYFGVNKDKTTGKKKNHQTFFVAPTVKNIIDRDTIQSGFTIENGQQIFLYEVFKKYTGESEINVQKASFFSLIDHHDGLILNVGTGTPPDNNN